MIALVGCGTVGGGTALLLTRDIKFLKEKTGLELGLKYVVDINFDNARAIGIPEELYETDLNKVLNDPEVTIVIELVGGLTFAKDVVSKSLSAGKNVITANKALLATFGEELFGLARKNSVSIGFEASCAGGIPIVKAITEGMAVNRIDALYGIVNGTCNYILTQMIDQGMSYNKALKGAQAQGLAEADPTLDVNGMDSAHKITIMSSLCFGYNCELDRVSVTGIENIDIYDVKLGTEMGYTIKLLAIGETYGDKVSLRVQPSFISNQHPLAKISGPFNGVSLYGHAVGHTMYYGRGAGDLPTASAIGADIISVASGAQKILFDNYKYWPDLTQKPSYMDQSEVESAYYLRLNVEDHIGVTATVTKILAENSISISGISQKEARFDEKEQKSIPLVILTHKTAKGNIDAAIKKLKKEQMISKKIVSIPVIAQKSENIK
ncbi:homoserine dehydrogenase [Thiospirochaeta perfilievii]|uniref:Homoserine dehydrogenase n=1 Tax=Thiospirochaeta perfilievii TaxID=252967 RepID=A0A5C1QEG1_9SPIO|nr:homoserine dehydrogenase [Thiospirochaeta perfilievii]QEN05450.1 homoserine dehydrogenase [Thiospirochaeta perfilievii]